MKKLGLVLAVATVALLNVIPSSALLAYVLWRDGHRMLACPSCSPPTSCS